MTTHFTSGVTNVATGGTGEKLKLPDPIKYHVYHVQAYLLTKHKKLSQLDTLTRQWL